MITYPVPMILNNERSFVSYDVDLKFTIMEFGMIYSNEDELLN